MGLVVGESGDFHGGGEEVDEFLVVGDGDEAVVEVHALESGGSEIEALDLADVKALGLELAV
jgi:hypothetical protein